MRRYSGDKRIYKRKGSPYWYGRVKVDGRWVPHTLNTTDRKVAEIKFVDLERSSVDETYRAANATRLADAIVDFETSRRVKGCAAGTMHMYKIKAGHLVRLFGADLPLAHLEPPRGAARVDKFIATRLGEGASRNTIGKELTTLRGILRTAKRNGKFAGDLEAVLPDGWAIDYEPRRTHLTPEQAAALILEVAKPSPWERTPRTNRAACVAFIIATGARWSEAMRATRKQVDLKKGWVYFEISKTRRKGKPNKHVPITPKTRGMLEQVLAATAGRSTLFEPWSNVRRDLAAACARVEGCPVVTPNDLRRTHGNWLRDAGVDTSIIADVLGHTDSRMVEKVYGRLRPEQLRDRVLASVH